MTRRLEDSLIALFRQTLQEAKAGGYNTPSGYVALDATDPQLFPPRYYSSREAEFLAHESVEALGADALVTCSVKVIDADSYGAALAMTKISTVGGDKPPLVLNFANPHEPGGGVWRGALAQEEDLCRRSTLYPYLSSAAAQPFYEENLRAHGGLFTHNALLVPKVQVFRMSDSTHLTQPFEVSVLTMAAPYVPFTIDVATTELRETIQLRIGAMLRIAASNGYRRLVLGAWGCGAFGNDPTMVATCFKEELQALDCLPVGEGTGQEPCVAPFDHVWFAIPAGGINHRVFAAILDV